VLGSRPVLGVILLAHPVLGAILLSHAARPNDTGSDLEER
jgi:hypothetical protein